MSTRSELIEQFGLQPRDGGSAVGQCPFCDAVDRFWIWSGGWTCKACDEKGVDFDQLEQRLGLAWVAEPVVPGTATPDSIPVEALPAAIRDHADSVAAAGQMSPDMTVLFALSAISAACAGKIVVRVDDAWIREWVAFYGVVVAPPGERKSYAYRQMTEPLREWEAEEAARIAPAKRLAEEQADIAFKKLGKTKKAAVDGEATPDDVEAELIAFDRATRAVPVVPELLVQDATPEALVKQMAEQGGRVAIMSPEGGFLRILDGRYADGVARLEELAQAYDGEELRPRRIGRETKAVRSPALTLGIAIQPTVLDTIRNGRSLRGQGIYGRIAWVMPESRVGDRVDSSEARPIDPSAARKYKAVLNKLLNWMPETEDDGTPVPVVLTLSPEAAEVKREYHYRVEHAQRPGGEYANIRDAANKVVGRAVRIAVLLELAARAEDGRPLTSEPISGWAMESAVRICEALMTHTIRVFGEIGADQHTADLCYLLDWLRDLPDGTKETELRRTVQGRKSIGGAEDLADLIDDLVERGCVRRRHERSPGPGRPPSPVLELHPTLRDSRRDIAEIAENRSEGVETPNKRNLRNASAESEARPALSDDDPIEATQGARDGVDELLDVGAEASP